MPDITFVDEKDKVIDQGTRDYALDKGIVHRIVRILIFNSSGELLIQKRSPFVSVPNRWDQSAAGHVDAGETYIVAAKRELAEEVGIKNIELQEVLIFYTEEGDDGIIKKRFNTLYTGSYEGNIKFDTFEVSEVMWISLNELSEWMQKKPEEFTLGFIKSLNIYLKKVGQDA